MKSLINKGLTVPHRCEKRYILIIARTYNAGSLDRFSVIAHFLVILYNQYNPLWELSLKVSNH